MARTAGNLSARMAQGLSAQAIWIVWPAGTGACQAAGSRLLDGTARSLRLAAQDVALSRRKQGFESPRERQKFQYVNGKPLRRRHCVRQKYSIDDSLPTPRIDGGGAYA